MNCFDCEYYSGCHCYRYPPTVVFDSSLGRVDTQYPTMGNKSGCGEFKKRIDCDLGVSWVKEK